MIVLKHLAQEFKTDPYKIRQLLRQKFGHANNMRWKWEPDTPELDEVFRFLRSHFATTPTKISNGACDTNSNSHSPNSSRKKN